MPYYSDHYYGSAQPPPYYLPSSPYTPATSRISSPYSFSYMSPISAMLSAGIGTNPVPRGLRSYSPMLSSISESGSPLISRRDIGSPRHISGKTYYRQPRPLIIDTDNIDVSRRRKDDTNEAESTPGLISRGKTIVRMHTKKLKENLDLRKKKTQAELLMEKYLIKEKPKEEAPRRKRIWEEREEELSNEPAQAGTIKRTNTVHRKVSGQLPSLDDLSQNEIDEPPPQRKTSIDSDLLKAEAAFFDCMIQEELGIRSRKEIPDDKDIDLSSGRSKSKREFLPYGKKKSSTILLDENGVLIEKKKSHLHKKRSSRNLPLDEVNSDNILREGNEIETDGKVIKRRSTKKKKNLSGPLKFKIDALHVEEKSSPKLLRKFQYEVIVEEGDRKSIKQPLKTPDTQLDKSDNENIPVILNKNLYEDENRESFNRTSSASSENDANIRLLSKTCDSECDNKNKPASNDSSTGNIAPNKQTLCDNKATESVTDITEGKKENNSLKNTEAYMNKFNIKGFLEKQHKQNKEEDKKTSPLLDKRKKQKTDSIKPEDTISQSPTSGKEAGLSGEVKNSEVLNTCLKSVDSKVDHSIESVKENNTSNLNVNKLNKPFKDSSIAVENKKQHLFLPVEQPLTQQLFATSEGDPRISINVTPSTPVSPEEKKQVLQSLQSAELQESGKKKLPIFTAKSSPNTPVLSKKQFEQSNTTQSNLEIVDTDTSILKNKLPKSHPNTPLLSKKETVQENKEQPSKDKSETSSANNSTSKSNTNTPVLQKKQLDLEDSPLKKIGTPELDRKIKSNKTPTSSPGTPILQKREIIQKDQLKSKLGTPTMERKPLNKGTSEGGSVPNTFIVDTTNILEKNKMDEKIDTLESGGIKSLDNVCNTSLGTPVLHKKEFKINIGQPKIGTPSATRKLVEEETTEAGKNVPSIIKKEALQKEEEDKMSSSDPGKKKISSEISKSKPTTPVFSKKDVGSKDSVPLKDETPTNEFDPWKTILSETENKNTDTLKPIVDSSSNNILATETSISPSSLPVVNKDNITQEKTDQAKSEALEFARKKLGDNKPKSSPNTPVFKKREFALDSSTHKTTEPLENSKKTEANAITKSNPSTPILQKKERNQEVVTQERPTIGETTEVKVTQKSKPTTPIVQKKQIIEETIKTKFGTPELGRKFGTNATPKSDPSTPILPKKQLAQESSPLVQQHKFGTPELNRKKIFDVAPKSDPCTPIMSKKQVADPKVNLQNEVLNKQSGKESSFFGTKEISHSKNIPVDKIKTKPTETTKQNSSVDTSVPSTIVSSDTNDYKPANNFEECNKNIEKETEPFPKKPLLKNSPESSFSNVSVGTTEIHIDKGNEGNIKLENANISNVATKQENIATPSDKEVTKQPAIVNKLAKKDNTAASKVEGLKNLFGKPGKVEEGIKTIGNVKLSNLKPQDNTEGKQGYKPISKIEGKVDKLEKGNNALTTKVEENQTSVKKLMKQSAIDELSGVCPKDKHDHDKSSDNIKSISIEDKQPAPVQTKSTTEITKPLLNQDKSFEIMSKGKMETAQSKTETSALGLTSKTTKESEEHKSDIENSPNKEALAVKESRKKRIKSESDVAEDNDTTDLTGNPTGTDRKGSKTIEKSKSLDETKTEKNSKKKKKSKDKDSGKKKGNSKSPKKLKDIKQSSLDVKEIIQEKKSQSEAQKQTTASNDTGNLTDVKKSEDTQKGTNTTTSEKSELSKSEIRLLHFINKCIKLSADNESISVEMSDEEESSSSEYTSDSDSEYTTDSEEDTLTDDSSDDNNGSAESRDHGSPTRRHSNAALSLDEERSHPGRVTPPATTIPKFRKYALEDFQFLKVLGKGSFGKVLLAELRGTQYYYAVKCLKKDVVLEDDDVECTLIERKVLALGTNHPYLCHLFCTFQTDSHLFFVMEYLNGGDLMFHIQQQGRFDEGRARFYAAEITSGLKFLHKKGIIYRDLKLDNILLDFDGHVRIADFGMCKLQIFLDRTADTFCGTPDYMAPEIIKGLKYNQCVDWWSFGILLYEMLVGQSPFSGCDEDDLFWCICNRQPHYPRFITLEAKRILCQLLEKEATKRLGSCENGAEEVMGHPFFNGLDWGRLDRRDLMPPFKPNVKHPLDVHYFDKHFTAERACLTPIDPSILQSMDQTQFQGFSYTNPNVTE